MFGQWMEGVDKTLVHFVLFFIRTEEIPPRNNCSTGPPPLLAHCSALCAP